MHQFPCESPLIFEDLIVVSVAYILGKLMFLLSANQPPTLPRATENVIAQQNMYIQTVIVSYQLNVYLI